MKENVHSLKQTCDLPHANKTGDISEYIAKQELIDSSLMVENLAELLYITGQPTLPDAIPVIKTMNIELETLKKFRRDSPMLNDVLELLRMADEGQFKGMTQGTPADVKDTKTIIGLIYSSYDTLNVNDSYFVAKVIKQLSK